MNITFKQVIDYCQARQINLSPQQELILMIISQATIPLSSHEILTSLLEHNPRANRMTIHRALEFLIDVELIHKIAFNHTYKLCAHLYCKHDHHCQILICQKCGNQTEIHNPQVTGALLEISKTHNFKLANPVEITGSCAKCQTEEIL